MTALFLFVLIKGNKEEEFSSEDGTLISNFRIQLPYKDGDFKKISYTIWGGKINIWFWRGKNKLKLNKKDIVFKLR